MSLRVRQFALGSLPAGTAELSESIETVSAAVPSAASAEPSFLSQFRQKFLSDESLAERLQSGDTDALTILFERHAPRLLAIARHILRDDAEAEDAVQQVFLDAYRSIQRFDSDKGSFKTWLFMFGYQRIFNCRRSRSTGRLFDADPFDELSIGLQLESQRPARFSLPETAILIDQVLRHLQPRQRRNIELVYYEGLTAEEIAVRTGETVRVVRHNLYRGLEKLRKAVRTGSPSEGNAWKEGEK